VLTVISLADCIISRHTILSLVGLIWAPLKSPFPSIVFVRCNAKAAVVRGFSVSSTYLSCTDGKSHVTWHSMMMMMHTTHSNLRQAYSGACAVNWVGSFAFRIEKFGSTWLVRGDGFEVVIAS